MAASSLRSLLLPQVPSAWWALPWPVTEQRPSVVLMLCSKAGTSLSPGLSLGLEPGASGV